MSFSYDVTQLSTNTTYQVRYRLGDTEETSAAFQDEEIEFALSNHADNVLRACIECVTAMLPRIANKPNFKVGPYSESLNSSSFTYWSKLLSELKAQVVLPSAPIMNEPMTAPVFYYDMLGVDDYDPTDPSSS